MGVDSLILRDVPLVVLLMMLYEIVKKLQLRFKSDLNVLDDSLRGVSVGLIAGALTTPIDVVKTRLMTYSILEPQPRIRDIARQVYG